MEDQRIQELEAKVAELTSMVERLAAPPPASPAVEVVTNGEEVASRRGMLKLAGAAAAGAVAMAVGTNVQPAAAADGNALIQGNAGATGNVDSVALNRAASQTRHDYLGNPATGGVGFLFQAGTTFNNIAAGFDSALAGWTTSSNLPTGVYGFSNLAEGMGVVGACHENAGIGVLGRNNDGVAVRGEGETGVSGIGDGGPGGNFSGTDADGVTGVSTGTGTTTAGVRGLLGVYSIAANLSQRANLYLQPNNNFLGPGPKTPVQARTDDHLAGELESIDGELWFCVTSGTPGTWRKLTGPTTAGAFHPLTPGRVYDSRQNAPSPGIIQGPNNRTISVADRRDALDPSGAVVEANFVPAGALAVAANVTVTQTTASGFLTVNPGGNTTVGASTINWSGNNQDIANGIILTLNATRELTIVAGGGGTTHFIIDINGYYI